MKAWLSHENIPFVERDVTGDAQAEAELRELTGRVIVPVVAFDEMEVVVGAKTERLRKLAKQYGYLE